MQSLRSVLVATIRDTPRLPRPLMSGLTAPVHTDVIGGRPVSSAGVGDRAEHSALFFNIGHHVLFWCHQACRRYAI